jgi:RNA polymerase sigma-70 factor, ECF subfamily
MSMHTSNHHIAFERLRRRLFGIAYRMLGSRADAEDVLQDAWLRWDGSDISEVRSPDAWLVATVTRMAIDRLRAVKSERDRYVGEWLPEPIVDWHEETPERIAERSSSLSLGFLRMLERLSPDERAAFVLREAFDFNSDEIARTIGKTPAAVRQLLHRAGERLRAERARYVIAPERHDRLLARFVRAANAGDAAAIRTLIADDAEAISDGGGKIPAGRVKGADRIVALYRANLERWGDLLEHRRAIVNGEPGIVRLLRGQVETAIALEIDGERIRTLFAVRNPDKLVRVPSPS